MTAAEPSELHFRGKADKVEPNNKVEEVSYLNEEIHPGEQLAAEKDSSRAVLKLCEMVQADEPTRMDKKKLDEFLWTPSPQPHAVRRRAILKAHPEIEELYGADPFQLWQLIVAFAIQVYMAVVFIPNHPNLGFFKFTALAYFVSATCQHMLFTFLHECSHRTVVPGKYSSELLCVLSVVPMCLPAAVPFKRYHLDHHIHQGVENLDPDLPTYFEANWVRSRWAKGIWILFMPVTYSLRPMITRPKTMQAMDMFCWFMTFSSDILLVKYFGYRSLIYLLLGVFFAFNISITAGHFITEHLVFNNDLFPDLYQETTAYYGWLNMISLNVGYHVTHHDFPRVPGSRLPLATKIAAEFYESPAHDSWFFPVLEFIFREDLSCFNRVLRPESKGGLIPQEHLKGKLHDRDIPGDKFWPRVSNLLAQAPQGE